MHVHVPIIQLTVNNVHACCRQKQKPVHYQFRVAHSSASYLKSAWLIILLSTDHPCGKMVPLPAE